MVEDAAATAAFAATARAVPGVDAAALAAAARTRARELWRAAPVHPYCLRVGISSSEALWCRFKGDEPETRWLREWSPHYRREAWRLALADVGVEDPALAEELGERFGEERRARHETFPDSAPVLDALRGRYKLGLLTNGASDLQREKLAASGLEDRFDAVVVSAEVGTGKPGAAVFARILALLGANPGDAVMIGDSVERDVDGALAAGLRAVWVNREGRLRPGGRAGLMEVRTLEELPSRLPF